MRGKNSDGVGQCFFPPYFFFGPFHLNLHHTPLSECLEQAALSEQILQFPSKINISNSSRNGRPVCKSTVLPENHCIFIYFNTSSVVFEFSWDNSHDVLFGSIVSYMLHKHLLYDFQ